MKTFIWLSIDVRLADRSVQVAHVGYLLDPGRTPRDACTRPFIAKESNVRAPPSSAKAASRRPLLLGILACLLAASAAGAAFAFSSPLFSSGDESAHVDYAYQVWTGSLPEFHAGLVIKPGFGFVPPVQWVSQHPPLYYLIQAPVVGPLIDSGHYLAAGYAARAVNAMLAALLVGAVGWAAAQAFPRRPQLWLAAALVTAVNSWVVRVGGSVYNDLLCALCATLVLGITIRSLHRGATLRRDILVTLAAAAALATRASLIVVVAGCLTVLVIHRGLTTRSWLSTIHATGRYAIVGIAALVPSAWFYLRNLRLTGRLLGGDPGWAQANLHITPRPTLDVFTDPKSWKSLAAVFSYGAFERDLMTSLLLVLPLVLAIAAAVLIRRRTGGGGSLAAHETFGLVAGTALATVAMQLQYAAGGSGLNPRYLMPLVLAISLGVAYGLTQLPRAGLLLLVPWVFLTISDLVVWVARASATGPPAGAPYPTAAWAAVMVCVAAVAISLSYHVALTRATQPRRRATPVAATAHPSEGNS
ncbi:MAG: hypothetical protein ABI662_00075 [Dermatophilaceae bacterium]